MGRTKKKHFQGLPLGFRKAVEDLLKETHESSEVANIYSTFKERRGTTGGDEYAWHEYSNTAAQQAKDNGTFTWGAHRIYFDIPLGSLVQLRDVVMLVAAQSNTAIAFKFLDIPATNKLSIDGTETRFVTNFTSEAEAHRFFNVLKNNPAYQALSSDRGINYGGDRLDDMAEYAEGTREYRGALARILSAQELPDGSYEYVDGNGKKRTITKAMYENFAREGRGDR